MASGISLLKPLGYQRNRECGYCKTTSGSCSYYLSCDSMRIDHYQELVDRGWRRSGSTYYKPDLPRSCCPHYTIRLDAHKYKANREQRQAVNRWNNFILGAEYKRKAAMLCPQSRETKREKCGKFDVVEAVHKSEYEHIAKPIGKQSQKPIEPAHKFEVILESDKCTKEKHRIFLKYQTEIHKDPPSRWREESFKRFLCSGLNQQTLKTSGKILKLGSYHQCYRLDGRLVAVGVLDLLPHAVSSVYLFYDPEFEQWDFGKISALREIALAVERKYDWYYMGYYIHSCIKMRYKGNFQPSFLLDPETLQWNQLDDSYKKKLGQRSYVSPSRDQRLGEDAAPPGPLLHKQATEHSIQKNGSTPAATSDQEVYDLDSDPSDPEDTDLPEGSLFDYDIPGVLTKDEVRKLDLGQWKIRVRNVLVDFEDIRGWEEQRIDDPSSIKGIAAELAAAVGPQLLKNTAVVLF